MAFTSDVLVERTRAGQRQTVKEQGALLVTTIMSMTTDSVYSTIMISHLMHAIGV